MKANIKSLIVFDSGKGKGRYIILNKKTGIVHSADDKFISNEGNVTDRMNITFGYGWEKHWKKGKERNKIIKSEVDNFINESKGDSSIRGKEVSFDELPEFVKSKKEFFLTLEV